MSSMLRNKPVFSGVSDTKSHLVRNRIVRCRRCRCGKQRVLFQLKPRPKGVEEARTSCRLKEGKIREKRYRNEMKIREKGQSRRRVLWAHPRAKKWERCRIKEGRGKYLNKTGKENEQIKKGTRQATGTRRMTFVGRRAWLGKRAAIVVGTYARMHARRRQPEWQSERGAMAGLWAGVQGSSSSLVVLLH